MSQALASWNDTPVKAAFVDFVTRTTTEGGTTSGYYLRVAFGQGRAASNEDAYFWYALALAQESAAENGMAARVEARRGEALDLPRRLYDETLSGSRGFWILVVPGVIHNRQPRFNEGPAMWHLEGATLPLLNPLPAATAHTSTTG